MADTEPVPSNEPYNPEQFEGSLREGVTDWMAEWRASVPSAPTLIGNSTRSSMPESIQEALADEEAAMHRLIEMAANGIREAARTGQQSEAIRIFVQSLDTRPYNGPPGASTYRVTADVKDHLFMKVFAATLDGLIPDEGLEV